VNSSALLGRMNFSIALMSGKIKGVQVNSERLLNNPPDSEHSLAMLESSLLAGDVTKQTHDAITKQLESPQPSPRNADKPTSTSSVSTITGLLLGSPEFQRR
jgi:Protein of unknown function (DUF1800)